MLCKEISAAPATAKILAFFLDWRWHSDVCALKFCPPPSKAVHQIFAPLQLLAPVFCIPPFSPAPPAVNNDHSLNGLLSGMAY